MKSNSLFLPARNAIINHYIPNRVLGNHWLIAIPFVISLIVYSAFETFALANQSQSVPNIWEMLVGVLNNRPVIYHGLVNMLIFLISEIGLAKEFELQVLLRMGTRKSWFQTQLICILSCVTFYVVLILLIVLIIALPSTQWSLIWGNFIHAYIGQEGFPAVWLMVPPLMTVVFMAILMWMAWIFIGVITVFMTTLTQRPVFGFFCGVFLNYSAYFMAQSNVSWFQKFSLSSPMFLWKNFVLADSILIDFIFSCLQWTILISVGLIAFWKMVQHRSFMSQYELGQV